nr:hypothetical protein [Tanacetum cinerariifolium]
MIDSHLKNINHTMLPNEIDMDDLESRDELIDTPLVSPFLDSDDESDDEEVLIELDKIFDTYIVRMPRTIPSLKNFKWSKVPHILVLSQRDLMSELRLYLMRRSFGVLRSFSVNSLAGATHQLSSGNISSLAVGIPWTFNSQQSSPKLDAASAIKFLELNAL